MTIINKKRLIMAGVLGVSSIVLAHSSLADTNTVSHITSMQTGKPTPVDKVDLTRYSGTWYEIARLPLYFQRKCASDVTATYTLQTDGSIQVDNRCKTADNKTQQSIGRATKNGDSGSKLKVTFLPKGLRWLPFGKADYWILDLDDNYQYALVGTPNNKNLWILSRTPTMNEATYQALTAKAQAQGYNLINFKRTVQTSK